MSARDDGGAAFPRDVEVRRSYEGREIVEERAESGMSLRDYFAAKVAGNMMGLAADESWPFQDAAPEQIGEAIAKVSYAVADAMLVERAK